MTAAPAGGPLPDGRGHFGEFGGQYVPETLMPALIELEGAYHEAMRDPAFHAEQFKILNAVTNEELASGGG